jgi:hypothetical protein
MLLVESGWRLGVRQNAIDFNAKRGPPRLRVVLDLNDRVPMSSTLNPTPINPQINPQVIPKFAPDIVPTRADFDISKPGPDRKSAPSAAQKAPDATAGATVPLVDTAFRAASTNIRERGARPLFGRRIMRGVMGMVLTACLAGAAVLWHFHGGAVGPTVAESVPPVSAAPAVEASAVTAAAAPSAPQSAADNFASNAASALPDSAQLLQSMARDLSDLRQNMEQMKAGIAALKAGQDQMASEVAKTSEPNLRPWVSLVTQPPAQPIAALARKPPPIVRPVQPASGSPQGAAPYLPRRAVAPPPRSTAASPGDPPPPRPPAPLREQTP